MTKTDIIEAVHEKMGGLSKRDAAQAVEFVFEALKEGLVTQDQVKIAGFGNFAVIDKKARMGRNPATKEPIEISARRVLTFRPSQVIKHTLNA